MLDSNDVLDSFQGNAVYQIAVEGKIEPFLLQILNGQLELRGAESNGKQVSLLLGRVEDQAELSGILNTLYNHRLTIISVLKI